MGMGFVCSLGLNDVGIFRGHYGLKHRLVNIVSRGTLGRLRYRDGKLASDDVGTAG